MSFSFLANSPGANIEGHFMDVTAQTKMLQAFQNRTNLGPKHQTSGRTFGIPTSTKCPGGDL